MFFWQFFARPDSDSDSDRILIGFWSDFDRILAGFWSDSGQLPSAFRLAANKAEVILSYNQNLRLNL